MIKPGWIYAYFQSATANGLVVSTYTAPCKLRFVHVEATTYITTTANGDGGGVFVCSSQPLSVSDLVSGFPVLFVLNNILSDASVAGITTTGISRNCPMNYVLEPNQKLYVATSAAGTVATFTVLMFERV